MRFQCPTWPFSVDKSLGDAAVGVDAAVAQEGPVRARDVDSREVDGHEEDFLLLRSRLRDDPAARARHKALAPEFEAVAADRLFEADPVDRGYIAAVGHRVAALDDFPRALLVGPVRCLLLRVPAD